MAQVSHPISGVSTSETAFVDYFGNGPINEATRVESYAAFTQKFGVPDPASGPDALIGQDPRSESSYAIQQYFLNGGSVAWVVRVVAEHEPGSVEWNDTEGADALLGRNGEGAGIYALKQTGFSILCLPAAAYLSPASVKSVYDEAARFCSDHNAFLLVDIPPAIDTSDEMIGWLASTNPNAITRDKNAAVYFPRLIIADVRNENRPRDVGSSGTIAGIYVRTDATRGVWKAPAGNEATLKGAEPQPRFSDVDNRRLNPLAINALRTFPGIGSVCWGARTLEGADQLASEWKYIPVRRTALYVERSIYQGTQWAISEPNNEVLWSQLRLNVGDFMHQLFRSGAFIGSTPREAYFVKCDSETTTQNDIDNGVTNVLVGFAPLNPAEFVTITIQQMAGRIDP